MNALALLPADAAALRPGGDGFGAALRRLRRRAGLSQMALGARAGINVSYIHRMESRERGRPSEAVVLALARGLALAPANTDELLLAAGYAPTWLRYLGGEDSTVAALAAALTGDGLDAGTLADLRAVVETVCARFTGRVSPHGAAPPRRLSR